MTEKLALHDIKNVLILGAGTLGLRVGLQAALSGYNVKIYDINQKQLDMALVVQRKLVRTLEKMPTFKGKDIDGIIDGIVFTTDPVLAADGADIINESVIEDIDIKNKVWTQFGELSPAHTIFTTNTSFLLPSMFSKSSGRPERFCAFHFHDVFVANVVDIMPHSSTADWVIDLLYDFGKKLNQTPIRVKKESAGYVFNYMLMSFLQAAVTLLANGVSNVQDIDRSWMGNFNMPVGPFGMLDQVGLDTAWRIASSQQTPQGKLFASVLQEYVDNNHLGIKSGKGFYSYPNPEYQEANFLQ
ncbi:MAG: 3-hydroxyacyl-CoA dehydrogenase NAD-binding domain-containing protein [Reichenbachiella sp.]|uniref:3-hydroxyacyl-CoA dehydrogenase NAD-binding domain-containing protein n=1 Tax=Reichenbachiella sp. TaxID=2184521 RepID=UPI0032650AF7